MTVSSAAALALLGISSFFSRKAEAAIDCSKSAVNMSELTKTNYQFIQNIQIKCLSDKVSSEMMSLMTDEELATMLSRLEQQELDCQTGSGAVPGKPVMTMKMITNMCFILKHGIRC